MNQFGLQQRNEANKFTQSATGSNGFKGTQSKMNNESNFKATDYYKRN